MSVYHGPSHNHPPLLGGRPIGHPNATPAVVGGCWVAGTQVGVWRWQPGIELAAGLALAMGYAGYAGYGLCWCRRVGGWWSLARLGPNSPLGIWDVCPWPPAADGLGLWGWGETACGGDEPSSDSSVGAPACLILPLPWKCPAKVPPIWDPPKSLVPPPRLPSPPGLHRPLHGQFSRVPQPLPQNLRPKRVPHGARREPAC